MQVFDPFPDDRIAAYEPASEVSRPTTNLQGLLISRTNEWIAAGLPASPWLPRQ